ncbi:MAG: hypothetical protein ACLFSQ_08705 [Candidatus Zixiibacteriota bacterium]
MRIRFALILLLFIAFARAEKKPVIAEKTHLYDKPDVDSKKIDALGRGDSVIFITSEGDWSKVVHGTDYGWIISVALGRSAQDIRKQQAENAPKRTYLPPTPPEDKSTENIDELFESASPAGTYTEHRTGEKYIVGAGFESETPYRKNPHQQEVINTKYRPYQQETNSITANVPKRYQSNDNNQAPTDALFENADTSGDYDTNSQSQDNTFSPEDKTSPYSHNKTRFGYQGDMDNQQNQAKLGYEGQKPAKTASKEKIVNVNVPMSQREAKTSIHSATEQKPLPTDNISYDPDMFTGTGIGYPELNAMTGKMVRDLLACPIVSNKAFPPRVIIDASDFKNESSQEINLNIVTDDLRTQLVRASAGRILFVAREYVQSIEKERDIHKAGLTSDGYYSSKNPAGADFKLAGRIVSQNIIDPESLHKSNYFLFTFEMIDLNNGFIVWSNNYKILKEGIDSLIYK